MTEQPQNEAIIIQRDEGFPIRFRGHKLAEVSSLEGREGYDRSAETRHWTELTLYQTAGGKYICERRGCSRLPGEPTRRVGTVCETMDEVYAYFGEKWLSQRLYRQAGLERYEEVD